MMKTAVKSAVDGKEKTNGKVSKLRKKVLHTILQLMDVVDDSFLIEKVWFILMCLCKKNFLFRWCGSPSISTPQPKARSSMLLLLKSVGATFYFRNSRVLLPLLRLLLLSLFPSALSGSVFFYFLIFFIFLSFDIAISTTTMVFWFLLIFGWLLALACPFG